MDVSDTIIDISITHVYQPLVGINVPDCSCPRAFLPRKLICQRTTSNWTNTTFWYFCLTDTVNVPVDRFVIVSEHMIEHQPLAWGAVAFASPFGLLVLVRWSDPPGPASRVDQPLGRWRHFMADTIEAARHNSKKGHPMDIVLVNMEQVAGRHLGLTGDPSQWCDLISEDHNAKFAQAMDVVTGDVGQSGCIPGRQKRSNQIKPARSTKFIYITMKDYLTTWDWKGEFTDEEVNPWLEAIEQDRNGV